jgi:hypothetical protein
MNQRHHLNRPLKFYAGLTAASIIGGMAVKGIVKGLENRKRRSAVTLKRELRLRGIKSVEIAERSLNSFASSSSPIIK